MMRGKEAIAAWRAARSVMMLITITMIIRIILIKDNNSHLGPSIGVDRVMRGTITSTETETKVATTMDIGEDAMKEVGADLKKHPAAASSIKETTKCKTVSNQLLSLLTAAKCTGNRINRGCNKVLCYRNKLDRWHQGRILTSSNNR